MYISFGNVSIDELEKRTGWTFTKHDRAWLEKHRQDNTKLNPLAKEFHIFDVPFIIEVSEPLKDELVKLLTKYNDKKSASQTIQISVVTESDKERELREKAEQEKADYEAKLKNPNSVWNVKWHAFIPVKLPDHSQQFYFGFFINTYTTGYDNIPDCIDGHVNANITEEGIRGRFVLANPEKDNDANLHEDWNYIISTGLYSASGSYLGKISKYNIGEIEFDLRDAIELYKSITNNDSKEIHFDR